MLPTPSSILAAALLAGAATASMAQAQPATLYPPPANVVSLSATANLEVTKDWLTIAYGTTRDGADAGSVQSQLKVALDAALNEARKVAKPGQIEVQTGHFSVYPRYNNKGAAIGWAGSTELITEGRDSQGLAQLSGRISSMGITRVGFSLSREAREKVEGEVTALAIARYRAKAEQVARQFGFAGYTLREVLVSSADGPVAVPVLRAQAMRAPADDSLPVEAGKANVTITVTGSVQLLVR